MLLYFGQSIEAANTAELQEEILDQLWDVEPSREVP